jgi:hypothetical protein
MGFGQYSGRSYQGRGAQKTGTGKRERHAFNASELAHVWAHEGATYGNRSDRRMYFEQDHEAYGRRVERVSTIYSYGSHFPIASLYHVKGAPVVLFTLQDYSVSTSKHKSEVRSAISHLPVHYVEHPREPQNAQASFKRAIEKALEHARSPRVRNISFDLRTIRKTVEHGNAFAKQFGFKWRLKMPRDWEALKARAAELDAMQDERRAVRKAAVLEAAIREWRAKPELLKPRSVIKERGWNASVLEPSQSPEWTADDAAELVRRNADRIGHWRTYGGRVYDLPGTLLAWR